MTPKLSRVKALLPYTITMQQVVKAATSVKQALFSPDQQDNPSAAYSRGTIKRKARYRGVNRVLSKKIKLSHDYIFRLKKSSKKRATVAESHRRIIVSFLQREDNSFQMPGKRDQVRGHGIYALCDTMKNLHAKLIRENPGMLISLATFCRARTRYIKLSKYAQRKVCLCHMHANVALMIEAVKILPKSTSSLVSMSDAEIQEKLESLEEKPIKYYSWTNVEKMYNGKKIRRVNLKEKVTSTSSFIQTLLQEMPKFRKHCERVEIQYKQIRMLKESLTPELEATCQLDYSENWKANFLREITSAYYEKNQLTIHPMVIHHKDEEGNMHVKSYVGISDVTAHSVPTTFSFIKCLIVKIKEHLPRLGMLHFISDSPSSQYRNRSVCDLVSRFNSLFGIAATWSWLESGHGKGACDGVGVV